MGYTVGLYQVQLDETINHLKDSWNKPTQIDGACENNTGITWSYDCGVYRYYLPKVPTIDLIRALINKLRRGNV